MLREISRFRNYGGHSNRRVFSDSDMDLYVWFNGEAPERFHLTYHKPGRSHSVSWNNETGFRQQHFARLEAVTLILGISNLLGPLFIQNTATISAPVLANQFLHASDKIAPSLADFIYARLLEYPGHSAAYVNQDTVLRSF